MYNKSFISRILRHSIERQIIVFIAVILLFEYFTVLVMHYIPPQPVMLDALIDCTILTILLTPVVYFLVIRPMKSYKRQKSQAEDALKQSEERYRNIVETLYEGILIKSTEGEILFTNKRFSEMLGYTSEEIIGHFCSEYTYDDQTDKPEESRKNSDEGMDDLNVSRFRRKDGSLLITQFNSSPHFDQNGEPVGYLEIHIDVTELKKAGETFRQKAEDELLTANYTNMPSAEDIHPLKLLHELQVHQVELLMQNDELQLAVEKAETAIALYDFAPMGYFTLDQHYNICNLNVSGSKMLGSERSSMVSRNFIQFIKQDDLPVFKDFYRKVIETNLKQTCEVCLSVSDASIFVHLEGVVSEFQQEWLLTAVDITKRIQSEEELRRSEQKLKYHFENSPLAVIEWDSDFTVTQWSIEAEHIFGWEKAETLGKRLDMLNLICQEDIQHVNDIFKRLSSGNEPIVVSSNRNVAKSGEIIDLVWYNSVLTDENGTMKSVMSLVQDVTERKKAEDKLRESEERYKSIFFDNLSVMLLIDPSSGKIIEANPAACNYYGWTYAELRKMNISDINILKKEETISIMQKAAEVKSNQFFFKHRLASGEIRDVEVFSAPIMFGQSQFLHSIVHDITERIQAEIALKESEYKFSKYIDFAPHGIFVANESGEYVDINSAAIKMTGYQKEELLSMKITDIVPEASFSEAENHFKTLITYGFASGELPFLKKDGSKGYWVVDAVKLSDKSFLGFTTETTERKLSELKLLQKDRLVSESQSTAHIGSYSANLITKIWQASDEIYRIFGIDKTHSHTLEAWIDCIHPDFREELNNDLQNAIQKENRFDHEYKIIRVNDIQERWVHGIGYFEFDEHIRPVGLIGTIQDVTARKTAELAHKKLYEDLEDIVNERTSDLLLSHIAIQEAEEKYRTVAENTYDWETWVGPDGKYIYISPSCKQITGYAVADFMNDTELFFKIAHPEDREQIEKHYFDQMEGRIQECSIDFRIISSDGKIRWIGHNCHQVFNGAGKFIGHRGSNRDITERKIAETVLIDSQIHLRELSHRMDVITEEERIRIAREIHDELGHLLTALKYDMDGLSNNTELTIDLAKSEMESMISIVDSLIDSVRKIATELRPGILDHLGLFPALEWKIKDFQKRTKICIHLNLDEGDFSFDKNETTIIYRIFQEILTNVARHAKASQMWLTSGKENDYFVLSVKDNGVGFELKEKQQTGSLGLMGMRERAMSIGGEIQIESSPRQGTTVNFLLKKS